MLPHVLQFHVATQHTTYVYNTMLPVATCAAVPWSVIALGSEATLITQAPAARGSGQYGMILEASDNQPIMLTGPAVTLDEGELACCLCHTNNWHAPAQAPTVIGRYVLSRPSQTHAAAVASAVLRSVCMCLG
jgi:hypothetical protein